MISKHGVLERMEKENEKKKKQKEKKKEKAEKESEDYSVLAFSDFLTIDV